MVIELQVINTIAPLKKGCSGAKYIPFRIFQKKLFVTENMELEECLDAAGKHYPKYSVARYNGEYYKLNSPYEQLKERYFMPIIIKGFM